MRHFLYVIGEPGTGKSTLVAELAKGAEAVPVNGDSFNRTMHVGTDPLVVEIGERRERFPGTDALAMNVQPKVEHWIGVTEHEHFLAEGDRLANARFFDYLVAAEIRLLVARLYVGERTQLARLTARGQRQDGSWLRGRRTKVERLAATFPERTIHVRHEDGDTEQALELLRERSPVAGAFP